MCVIPAADFVKIGAQVFKGRLWLLYRVCTGTDPKTRIHMQERTCLIFLQISTSSKFDLVSWTYICGNQAPMRRVVMGSYPGTVLLSLFLQEVPSDPTSIPM